MPLNEDRPPEAPAFWGPRVLSALVMAPIALGLAWVGGWAFATLLAVAAIIMAHELGRLLMEGGGPFDVPLLAGTTILAVFMTVWGAVLAACLVVMGMGLSVLGLRAVQGRSLWPGLIAYLYLGLPMVAFCWMRTAPHGLLTVIWLLMLVWSADTCALLVGKLVGGPKLAPRISPSKTWSGFFGGMAGAALMGAVVVAISGEGYIGAIALVSGGLGILAQAGDLFESHLKRRRGIKDSSRLIPGHGGLLDRVDGLIAAAAGVGLVACIEAILGVPGGMFIWT